MRIVILGASGQLGRIIFNSLRKKIPQSEILACVRPKHLHFEGVAGDHQQRSVVFDPMLSDWSSLGRIDFIINCIGAIDESEISFEKIHLLPLFHLKEQFEKLGRPKLIQISALGARPDSPSAFMRTKWIAEKIALQFPQAQVIRPSIVCTEGTMMVRRIRQLKKMARFFGGKIPFPEEALHTEIQPVAPEDLAALVLQLIRSEQENQIIELTGAEKFEMETLLGMAKIRPRGISKKPADFLMKIISPFLKNILSSEQYLLLSENNTGANSIAEKIIGRNLRPTKSFWEKELSRI